ncbi:hypothetical protein [Wenyingzhuangia sp. IMCC45574]
MSINYMRLKVPLNIGNAHDESMGLAGLHYLIPVNQKFYAGFNTHAALFGDQGGLFTLGIEAGITQSLYHNLFLNASINIGGGGGYRDLINKGGYYNPNIGLLYNFNKVSLGVQYSYFDFYSGHIRDNSLSFVLQIPTEIKISKYHQKSKLYKYPTNYKSTKKNSFSVKLDQYLPFGKTRKDREQNSELLRNTLYLVGFEYQNYINDKTFFFVHTDAVYSGLVAGFMDVFGGIGYEPIQTKYFNIFTKLGIGAAGGRVRAEGGATIYPSAGIDYHISQKTSVFAHAGYTKALDGYFEAYTFGGGIKLNSIPNEFYRTKPINIKTNSVRLSIQHQTYFNVKRIIRTPLNQLHLLALQVNYNISKNVYLIGQAAFAYESGYEGTPYTKHDGVIYRNFEGSGGYADGMVGLGVYSPIFATEKFQPFAEILVGAGGGAGIDTGGGILSKIKIGSYYKLNSYLSLLVSGGKVVSPFANVNSNNVNIGLSVDFSTLKTVFK